AVALAKALSRATANHLDPMKRAVQRRPQQFGHARIENGELARLVLRLHVDDTSEKCAGRAGDCSARLDDNWQPGRPDLGDEGGDVLVGRWNRRAIVGNPEAPAQIDILEPGAVPLEIHG